MKYDIEQCNINGCGNSIYKDGLCKDHYDFYMHESYVRDAHKDFVSLQNGTAGVKLKLRYILQLILHYAFAIPEPFVEHFPLEHIFLSELFVLRSKTNAIDADRYKKILRDFDCKANENVELMRCLLYSKDVDELNVYKREDYLFDKDKLPSKWPIILAIISFVSLFFLLKIEPSSDLIFCGCAITDIHCYIKEFLPIALFLMVALGIGLSIPSTFNSLIRRGYDLSLFHNMDDNVQFLHTVAFVRDRRDKLDYYMSIAGCILATVASASYKYINASSINWYTFSLFVCIVALLVSMLVVYVTLVFYAPMVECFKHRDVKILLYNPDGMGGLKVYHSFLYRTFIYNSCLFVCVVILITIIQNWWLALFCMIVCVKRVNHARWSFKLYVRSVRLFLSVKRVTLENLLLQNNMEALEQAQWLHGVHWTKANIFIRQLCGLVILPIAIENRRIIVDYISKIIRMLWPGI